jgi:hypothetical protein
MMFKPKKSKPAKAKPAPDLGACIERLKAGCLHYHAGAYLEDEQMTNDGLDVIIAVKADMKRFGAEARQAFEDLTLHPDPKIRVIAAAELLKDRPEVALPVLIEVRDEADDDAYMTAMLHLHFYTGKHPELNLNDYKAAPTPRGRGR